MNYNNNQGFDMRKMNYVMSLALLLIFLNGCGKNKDSENSDMMGNDTTKTSAVQSGVEYNITLNGNELTPDTIKLISGVCYQINFENNGNSEVEFIAGKDLSNNAFSKNFFEGLSVENIINNKETENKEDQSVTGIKLKPGEKGSLAFTPDDSKKGEWLTAVKTDGKTSSKNGVIVIN